MILKKPENRTYEVHKRMERTYSVIMENEGLSIKEVALILYRVTSKNHKLFRQTKRDLQALVEDGVLFQQYNGTINRYFTKEYAIKNNLSGVLPFTAKERLDSSGKNNDEEIIKTIQTIDSFWRIPFSGSA